MSKKGSGRLTTQKIIGESTLDAGDKENKSADIFAENDDALEKRTRRRQSRFVQQRRKSLTPATKKKQYITDMYSTIIQMSSENKINQKNTWSLPLIDHMDDILDQVPENEHENLTYNFQKASCTLDASVKIYSHRVDDTWNSSFKILENLTRSDSNITNPTQANGKHQPSKKLGEINTVEANASNITLKSLDLDFQVDPLFQKMSKVFDEGGAKGMLLVNLSIHNGCSLAFDSTDSLGSCEEHDENSFFDIDIKLDSITGLQVCPKAKSYYDILDGHNVAEVAHIIDDTEEWIDDSISCNDVLLEAEGGDDSDDDMILENERQAVRQECDLLAQLDDEPLEVNESSYIEDSSFAKVQVFLKNSITLGSNEYSYFNPQLISSWTGPKHWKKHGKRASVVANSVKRSNTGAHIDFMKPKIISFRRNTNLKSYQMTDSAVQKIMENADQLVFPVDLHFSASELFSLFLRPKYQIQLASKQHIDLDNHASYDNPYEEEDDAVDNEFVGDDIEFMDDQFATLNLVEPDRIVDQIQVKYDSIAKRVDVKNLKENIWGHVEEKKTSVHQFDSIVQTVSQQAPSNATVSFYFICMLHLANEKGLELLGEEDLTNFTILHPIDSR